VKDPEKLNFGIIEDNLDWPLFNLSDEEIAKKINMPLFYYYLKSNNHLPMQYLKDFPLHGKDLQNYYTRPKLFQHVIERPEHQWLYWGPPSSMTEIHVDVDDTHAWSVVVKGKKLWWFWLGDTVKTLTQHPGEVLFVKSGIKHAVVNVETTLAITHNFKFIGKKKHQIKDT
tara:strand:- start:836 stop:1348 length:513 start_codon:yes stop_codon:yes gene_type:complete